MIRERPLYNVLVNKIWGNVQLFVNMTISFLTLVDSGSKHDNTCKLLVEFFDLYTGLLIFRAFAEPRNSGKFAKSHEIRKKSHQIHVCTTYLKLISYWG